jgi:hypothetical protein
MMPLCKNPYNPEDPNDGTDMLGGGPPGVFERVTVDYIVTGCARVEWTISSHFHDPEPWEFQLQVAEADIASANWIDVGPPVTNSFFTTDPNQRWYGKEENAFYRVKLTTPNGTYFSSSISTEGKLPFKLWNFAREIVRKEILRLRALGVGIEGWLLKAKRSGVPCTQCLDPRTGEVTDSNCATCYGQRWVGGYYTPIPTIFGDIAPSNSYLNRQIEGGEGMVNVRTTQGIFVASPFIAMNDVWVNKTSDDRYHIHNVDPLTHVRGVSLIVKAELRLIPSDNIIYRFPVPN